MQSFIFIFLTLTMNGIAIFRIVILHINMLQNLYTQKIPKGELHPCVAGKSENNLSKNRYTTIFPCESTHIS